VLSLLVYLKVDQDIVVTGTVYTNLSLPVALKDYRTSRSPMKTYHTSNEILTKTETSLDKEIRDPLTQARCSEDGNSTIEEKTVRRVERSSGSHHKVIIETKSNPEHQYLIDSNRSISRGRDSKSKHMTPGT
jgi:hypothetical protein